MKQKIFIGFKYLNLMCFIFGLSLSYAQEKRTRAPCGTDFFRACDNTDTRRPAAEFRDEAVIPKLIKNIKRYFSDWGKFIYNNGTDIYGKPVPFPEGMAVNLTTGEAIPYGSPVCSICKTIFNAFKEEYFRNIYGSICGMTNVTATITATKIFIDPGEIPQAWFRGIMPIVLNYKLREALEDIKKTKTLAYTNGCEAFGLKMDKLTNEKNGVVKDLTKLMGEGGLQEAIESEGDFDRFLTKYDKESPAYAQGLAQVNESVAKKNPLDAKLKQLAHVLRGIIMNLESAAMYLVACSVFERTGSEFRRRYASFPEFFNYQVVDTVKERIQYKVARECGFCRQMGTCLACANRVANHYAPIEVERFYRERVAPFCQNYISSDQQYMSADLFDFFNLDQVTGKERVALK